MLEPALVNHIGSKNLHTWKQCERLNLANSDRQKSLNRKKIIQILQMITNRSIFIITGLKYIPLLYTITLIGVGEHFFILPYFAQK